MKNNLVEEILCDAIEIRSPERLYAVVEDLKKIINLGLLEQIGGNSLLSEVDETKEFPRDYITMLFKTIPGGTHYYLVCETYHGQGGVFSKGTLMNPNV